MKHNGNQKNAAEAVDFGQMLSDRRSAILAALGSKVDGLTRADRVSDEDQAQASHEEFVSLRLNGMEYRQLRDIQSAIQKIRSGEFGVCENCEEPIAQKRLRAIPWAKFCISCQEAYGDTLLHDREPAILSHSLSEHAIS
jgi:DnaK suppressor protein